MILTFLVRVSTMEDAKQRHSNGEAEKVDRFPVALRLALQEIYLVAWSGHRFTLSLRRGKTRRVPESKQRRSV